MAGEQFRVVVADRDVGRRRATAAALENEGYGVIEADDGPALLGQIEYLAAVMGRRRGHSTITADTFAVVAAPDLPGITAAEMQELLEEARWKVPLILLPADTRDAGRRLRSVLREMFQSDR